MEGKIYIHSHDWAANQVTQHGPRKRHKGSTMHYYLLKTFLTQLSMAKKNKTIIIKIMKINHNKLNTLSGLLNSSLNLGYF